MFERIVGILVVVMTGQIGAQVPATRVPSIVQQAMHARFRDASAPEWKKKSSGAYEAEFVSGRVEIAAQFDAGGRWLETEASIPRSAVPAPVDRAVARQFPGYQIVETQTVESAEHPRALIYELHMQNATTIEKVQLDKTGSVLNASSKPRPPAAQ